MTNKLRWLWWTLAAIDIMAVVYVIFTIGRLSTYARLNRDLRGLIRQVKAAVVVAQEGRLS